MQLISDKLDVITDNLKTPNDMMESLMNEGKANMLIIMQ